MAHLSDDRAQMLLIGGLAMAVAFVALALVLNSSVYVENLANRENVVVGGQGPTGHQSDLRRGVGKAVVAGNANGTSLSDREADVERGVTTLRGALRAYHAERATVANVTLEDTDRGTRVFRSTDGNFSTPNGDDPHWFLDTDATRYRRFSMNVSRSDLKDITLAGITNSDVFRIVIDDGSNVWKIFIYQDSLAGETVVESTDPSGSTCVDTTGTRTDINITSARVAGEHCEALDFFESVEQPYTVEFRNGGDGNVSGRYDFTVEEQTLSPDYAGDSEITTREVVYDATVEAVYYSSDAKYVAKVRVAPGEPDA